MALALLLVEDDPVLAAPLERLGHRVTVARDGPDALAALVRSSFDAIVLELMLPATNGIALLQRLRREGVTIPIIVQTALGRLSERIEGLDAGADDYLVKPVDPLELDARLRAVRRGRGLAAPESDTIRAGDIVVSPAAHRAWRGGVALELSRVELALLAELARHAGAVVSRQALYDRLWEPGFAPATNLADAHIRRLRQKLTARGRADPIVTVRGVGYKLRD